MRNLKRALSLALASAMLLGMMVVGSSAASYADVDSADHVEAIEVLQAISVMSGDDKGNFNPDQVVTRAEMAVIVCNILYGKNLNVSQFVGINSFSDVPAWAEGYVNLAASLGIVAGVGNGKFAPNEPVTTAQAALMLSRALGYFQTDAEFAKGWMLAATERGTQIGLYDNLETLSATAGLKRNDVAQMAFNALTVATPVGYSTLVQSYYTIGTSAVNGVVEKGTDNASAFTRTLASKNFDLMKSTNAAADDFYRIGNVWTYKGEVVCKAPTTPNLTYTGAVKQKDLYNTLGAVVAGFTWSGYTNGNTPSAYSTAPSSSVSTAYGDTADGVVTEIYVTYTTANTGTVRVVSYKPQIAQIEKITANAVTLKYSSNNGTSLNSTLSVASTSDFYAKLAAMKVDDYLAIVLDSTTLKDVASVKKDSGAVTKYVASTNTYTVNGTEYVNAAINTNAKPVVGTSDYDVYLSEQGYILYAKAATVTTNDYLFVVDLTKDGNAMSGYSYVAQALMADGTLQWIKVSNYNDSTVESNLSNFVGNPGTNANKFYSYAKLSDGTYKLMPVSGNVKSSAATANIVANGTSYATTSDGTMTTTNSTVYLVKGSNGSYTAYTGYRNVPAATGVTSVVLSDSGVAKMIVVTASSAAAATDYILVLDLSKYTESVSADKTAIRTYAAIVNGTVGTIDIKASETPAADTFYVGNTYATDGYISALATDDDGDLSNGEVVTAADKITLTGTIATDFGADTKKVVAHTSLSLKLVDGVLVISDGSKTDNLIVANGFAAYVYDSVSGSVSEKTVETLSLDDTANTSFGGTGDYILVITDKNGEVTHLFAMDLA